MKLKLLITLSVIMFFSCSEDDSLTTLQPEISFVYEDGTELQVGDCIDPRETYFLQLRLVSAQIGEFQPTKVDYTLNGEFHSVTFTSAVSKLITVKLDEGENIAQVANSGNESRIFIAPQLDFELVE